MSGTYNKMKDAEDHVYWKEVAEILDCQLIGWTYRHTATMTRGRFGIEVPSWLAERVRELAAKDERIAFLERALEQMADINALSIVKTFDRGRWIEEVKSQWGGRCTWTTVDQIPDAAAYLREKETPA